MNHLVCCIPFAQGGFFRQFACEGITIADVLKHAPGSRRALEREFRRLLGRTLQQEIIRIWVETARRLLRETDRPATEIAADVAMTSPSQFSVSSCPFRSGRTGAHRQWPDSESGCRT